MNKFRITFLDYLTLYILNLGSILVIQSSSERVITPKVFTLRKSKPKFILKNSWDYPAE